MLLKASRRDTPPNYPPSLLSHRNANYSLSTFIICNGQLELVGSAVICAQPKRSYDIHTFTYVIKCPSKREGNSQLVIW